MKARDVLGDLQARAALLQEEMDAFSDPADPNAVETLRGKMHDWLTELRMALEPYPDRWEWVGALIAQPCSLRGRPMLGLQSALAIYRQRLAEVLQGWTD